jgi:hypothetical protein
MLETSDDSIDAIKRAVTNITKQVEGARIRAQEGKDIHLQAMLLGNGGWNIVEVLKTAATCAFMTQAPLDHPDVVIVRKELQKYGF